MNQKDALRNRKIYNDLEIAELGDQVFVGFATNGGRSILPSWWAVCVVGKSFKDAPWYAHGAKTYSYSGRADKVDMLTVALAYASQVAGCEHWVLTPYGGYVTKNTADKVGLIYQKVKWVDSKLGERAK